MGNVSLPNAARILSAARSYKRACRTLAARIHDIEQVGGWLPPSMGDISNEHQQKYWHALQDKKGKAEVLLYLVETGNLSYPRDR